MIFSASEASVTGVLATLALRVNTHDIPFFAPVLVTLVRE